MGRICRLISSRNAVREKLSLLSFYPREREHDCSEHDKDNARRAVESFGLSPVGYNRGDMRPDKRERNAEQKHREVGHTAYRKMRHRAREGGEGHYEYACADCGLELVAEDGCENEQHHHAAARADKARLKSRR